MSDHKTEQPTQKRLEKARKEGQVIGARDFVAALQMLTAMIVITFLGPSWFRSIRGHFREWLNLAFRPSLDLPTAASMMQDIGWAALTPIAMGSGILLVICTGAQLALSKGAISVELLGFKPDRLNPVNRIRQMASENLFNAAYGVFLFGVTAFVLWMAVRDQLHSFVLTARAPIGIAVVGMFDIICGLLWQVVGVCAVVGCVDLFRKYRKHQESLRMTKQEVRDELRDSEGRPEVKQKIRAIQRNVLRRRMMNAVPTATVVVVNPTHYAVAIKYDVEAMAAPTVVAKGRNFLAQRIRERARQHGVMIVENPMVARALYKSVHVGQEIPPSLYRAVAEVLAYVFDVMAGKLR
jgi:flagellar biosynthetic protein FlhB